MASPAHSPPEPPKPSCLKSEVIDEDDLVESTQNVRVRVAEARCQFIKEGFAGSAVGLLLVFASRRQDAAPDTALKELCRRCLSLYLGGDANVDETYFQDLFVPRRREPHHAIALESPINVFVAAGSGRWWGSRAIPGGLAISVNAVGLYAHAGLLGPASSWGRRASRLSRSTMIAANCLTDDIQLLGEHGFSIGWDADVAIPSEFFEVGTAPALRHRIERTFSIEPLRCAPQEREFADWSMPSQRSSEGAHLVPISRYHEHVEALSRGIER